MKKLLRLTMCIASCLAFAGCISDREYQLRAKSIEAQSKHPATYESVRIKGPLTIPANGEIVVNVPSQPFVPQQIPDGMATQRAIIRDVVTGAIIGYGAYQIGAGTSGNTYNTTNNNAAGGATP